MQNFSLFDFLTSVIFISSSMRKILQQQSEEFKAHLSNSFFSTVHLLVSVQIRGCRFAHSVTAPVQSSHPSWICRAPAGGGSLQSGTWQPEGERKKQLDDFQRRCPKPNKRTHLLWSTADKGLRVQQGIQLPQDGGEVGVFLDSGQQVVVSTFLFNYSCCLLGQNPDLLVAVLEGNQRSVTREVLISALAFTSDLL